MPDDYCSPHSEDRIPRMSARSDGHRLTMEL